MRGGLVYVMGPSGAGKDSLIAHARAAGPADWPVMFAHRYITRPADAGGENHVAVSDAEFERLLRLDLLAHHWTAHEARYGIGREVDLWRRAGLTVVVSGSRSHFAQGRASLGAVLPVLVTARPETLAARLAARGREGADAVAARLRRGAAAAPDDPELRVIENDGTIAEAGGRLIELIAEAAACAAIGGGRDGRSG